jgi:SET domain-containing protein
MSSDENSYTHRLRDLACKAPSPIHGHGLFAKVRIEAGQYIGTYQGPRVKRDGTYVLWVYAQDGKPPVGRSGRNLLRWLNHQDEGNAEFDGFDLYAKRDIEAGEEITFNYSGTESALPVADPDSA